MTNRGIHSAEFKRDATELALNSGKLLGTARDLSIHISLLWKWMPAEQGRGAGAFPGQGKHVLTAEQAIQRLRKENEILRQEREIFKEVAANLEQNDIRMAPPRCCAKETTP